MIMIFILSICLLLSAKAENNGIRVAAATETATETTTAEEQPGTTAEEQPGTTAEEQPGTTAEEQTTAEEPTTLAPGGSSTSSAVTSPPTQPPVHCLTNSDCPSSLPFCQQNTLSSLNFCQACIQDFDCRGGAHCNAVCVTNNFGINKCETPVGGTRLQCTHTQVCYISQASCQQSCLPTGNAPSEAAANCANASSFSIPVGGKCNLDNGVCYDCASSADCGISQSATCNSACVLSPTTYQYSCSQGQLCSYSESCQSSGSGAYSCVQTTKTTAPASAGTIIPAFVFLLCLLAVFTL